MISRWEGITAEELRVAAKVARASGGAVMTSAAEAWILRAELLESKQEFPLG